MFGVVAVALWVAAVDGGMAARVKAAPVERAGIDAGTAPRVRTDARAADMLPKTSPTDGGTLRPGTKQDDSGRGSDGGTVSPALSAEDAALIDELELMTRLKDVEELDVMLELSPSDK